jgi:hypothetical protein
VRVAATPAEAPVAKAPATNTLRRSPAPQPAVARAPQPSGGVQQAEYQQPAKPLPAPTLPQSAAPVAKLSTPRAAAPNATSARKITTPAADLHAAPPVRTSAPTRLGPTVGGDSIGADVASAGYYEGQECVGGCDPGYSVCDSCCDEPACGCAEPVCGCAEPMCGCIEPGCEFVEPGCGCEIEESCGCAEPDCGMVGCGSCVGNPGPDYWCFPVCLPRLKEMTVWGGAHGFKGPRDLIDGGPGDNNFGFQEGFNMGGRAPLVSLILPQVSYQLGYQAVQSRLSGTSDDDDGHRSQHFVTGGLFRRVRSGVQFGVVWDLMRDDLEMEEDFQQLRYEVSLKSQGGREVGFWGCSNTNTKEVDDIPFETVDQHCMFFRLNFREGGSLRIFGGATNNSEGIVGADFLAPLSNRWSVNTGFNYLIPDAIDGPPGAQEESWNVGCNLVWHWGATAKAGNNNPHAPLFPVADNGWMFIDQVH